MVRSTCSLGNNINECGELFKKSKVSGILIDNKVDMTYKQVFIINTDLGMSKGKIAVQVAHGEVYYMEMIIVSVVIHHTGQSSDPQIKEINIFDKWRSEENALMKKVVLKTTEQDMNQISLMLKDKNIWHRPVHDRGLTQIEEGSFTCLVVEPLSEEQCNELFGHLKLL